MTHVILSIFLWLAVCILAFPDCQLSNVTWINELSEMSLTDTTKDSFNVSSCGRLVLRSNMEAESPLCPIHHRGTTVLLSEEHHDMGVFIAAVYARTQIQDVSNFFIGDRIDPLDPTLPIHRVLSSLLLERPDAGDNPDGGIVTLGRAQCHSFENLVYFDLEKIVAQRKNWTIGGVETHRLARRSFAKYFDDPEKAVRVEKMATRCVSGLTAVHFEGALNFNHRKAVSTLLQAARAPPLVTITNASFSSAAFELARMAVFHGSNQLLSLVPYVNPRILLIGVVSHPFVGDAHFEGHMNEAFANLLGFQLISLFLHRHFRSSTVVDQNLEPLSAALLAQKATCYSRWKATDIRLQEPVNHANLCGIHMQSDYLAGEGGVDRPPFCMNCNATLRACKGGEVLYNGICLSSQWPPSYTLDAFAFFSFIPPIAKWKSMPVPPYLATPPAVIPVHLNRQLFVDDFLVDPWCTNGIERTWQRPFLVETIPDLSGNEFYHAYMGSSFFDPTLRRNVLYMGRRGPVGKLPSSSYPIVRFVAGGGVTNDDLTFSLSNMTVVTIDGRPSNVMEFTVSLTMDVGADEGFVSSCRYLLGLLVNKGRYVELACSHNGLDFTTVRRQLVQVVDGAVLWWNPFRRKLILYVRDNIMMTLRTQRYAEIENITTARLAPFRYCSAANIGLSKIGRDDAKAMDVLARWSSCRISAGESVPVFFMTAHSGDLPYDHSFDTPFFHGTRDRNLRTTDLYAVSTHVYESVLMSVRLIHRGGRSFPELNHPTVAFSRDGFHHTLAGNLSVHPLVDPVANESSFNCLPVQQNGNRSEIWSHLICGGFTKGSQATTKPWNALYRLRKDGWAALRPADGLRADLWTTWLSMPRISSVYVNVDLANSDAELRVCLFLATKQLTMKATSFCFAELVGPLDSTAYQLKPDVTNLRNDSEFLLVNPIFKLQFLMYGDAALFSFWFNETTFVY